jgi:putative SOS response-associated peptidase YedK
MSGRYSIGSKAEKLVKRFKVDPTPACRPHYNAAPTQLLPVITSDSPEGLSFFYWGMVPAWSNNRSVSQKLINARAETLAEKATFKSAFQHRRCLIPADGFYEWKAIGKKTKVPYRFALRDDQLFAFAGIWDEFEASDGVLHHTFVIITTEANPLVHPIHDRMPVILHPEDERLWINPKTPLEQLQHTLRPYEADLMKNYSVSPEVNNIRNDYEGLLRHVPPADQHGNYTLFG